MEEGLGLAGLVEPIAHRPPKPRCRGVTMVMDRGEPPGQLEDWLAMGGPFVDVWKLGFGTAQLHSPGVLERKLALLKAVGIWVCPGGTLLELAWHQGRWAEFIEELARRGFTALEVSDGTVSMPRAERRRLIREGQRRGLRVITEVGKKDPRQALSADSLCAAVLDDLEAGAWKVIVEARGSGQGVGVFDEQGRLREALLEQLLSRLDPQWLIWEAPLPHQQTALLKRLGGDVNLGNVAVADVVALEASRRGLRNDTWAAVLNGGMR